MLKVIIFNEQNYGFLAIDPPNVNDLDIKNPNVYDITIEEINLASHGLFYKEGELAIPATEDQWLDYRYRDSSLAAVQDFIKKEIKSQCRKEIYKTYPEWKQLNIISAGGQNKTDMDTFLLGIRAKSDVLEAEVDTLTSKLSVLKYTIVWS